MTFDQAATRRSPSTRSTALGLALAALSFLGPLTAAATAIPVTLTVDPTQSSLTVSVSADAPIIGAISGSGTSTVSGTLDADVQGADTLSPAISATSGVIGLSDLNINLLDDGLFGTIDIATSGLIADVMGTSVTGTLAGGLFDFDLAGWTLTLGTGDIVVSATGLAQLALPSNPLTIDASSSPFAFDLPSPTIANALFAPSGPNAAIVVVLPVDISSTIDEFGVPASISLAGQIMLFGEVAVPEPGTLALLLAGLAGWARAGRARRS